MFEEACQDMVKTNLSFVFPYQEVLEPLVRCNLDGKIGTKDRLRMRRSDRIWDELEDGFTDEMISYGMTFGEDVNLNSEGDARFVTFQFRNLKEFLEENIEGQAQEKLNEHIERNGKNSKNDDFSMLSNSSMHSRRLSDNESDQNQNDTLEKLDMKEKVTKNDLLDAISWRILSLKKMNRSDFDINKMIDQNKDKFKDKLVDGRIDDFVKFDSKEQASYEDLGPGGRMLVKYDADVLDYSADLQRSPSVLKSVKRRLAKVDQLAVKQGANPSIIQKESDKPETENSTEKQKTGETDKQPEKNTHERNLESVSNSAPLLPKGYQNSDQPGNETTYRRLVARQLEKKEEKAKDKTEKKKRARRLWMNGKIPDYEVRRLNSPDIIRAEEQRGKLDNDQDRDASEFDDDEENEAHRISLLEHEMTKKLNQLLKKGSLRRKNLRNKDSVTFVVDVNKKYDVFQGIGKTGFGKIDFTEQRILREMAVYNRLGESIKMHMNMIYGGKSSSGNLWIGVVGVWIALVGVFMS